MLVDVCQDQYNSVSELKENKVQLLFVILTSVYFSLTCSNVYTKLNDLSVVTARLHGFKILGIAHGPFLLLSLRKASCSRDMVPNLLSSLKLVHKKLCLNFCWSQCCDVFDFVPLISVSGEWRLRKPTAGRVMLISVRCCLVKSVMMRGS